MREEKIFTYAFLVESEKNEHRDPKSGRKLITDRCCIRIYGLDQNNKTVCAKVKDFQPYCYIELQRLKMGRWTETLLHPVKELLCSFVGRNKPLSMELVYMKRLYDNETVKYPFLKCIFRLKRDMYILRKEIQKRSFSEAGGEGGFHEFDFGIGIKKLRFKFHETKAGEVLQLVCERDLPTAGWIKFRGIAESENETLADREYTVSRRDLHKCEIGNEPCASVAPLVMSFDIEAYSHNPCKFPDAEHPEDKVFMISCVFFRAGNDEIVRELLLTLGNPDEGVVGCECIPYKTESGLLEGFADLLRDMNPHIITGYNIMSFDIDYMIKRSTETYCESGFQAGGMHKTRLAEKKTMKWSSSAYKNQEFSYLNYEGRILIDLLPVIRRDYNKLRNYKLSTVSQHFIDSDKEDLPVKELFACYKVGVLEEADNPKFASMELGKAGKYCMVDSRLVARLFNKLNIWYGASEMAKTCNVPIFDLSTRGQQIRVYSQVYKHCLREKIVVQENGYVAKEGERYVGAYVFQPKAGAYNNIVPFDFASLYPTIIIAYNIDFSTLVKNPRVPDRHCHVIEWEDHLGCEHDKNVIRVKEISRFIDKTVENLKKMRKTRDTLKLKDFYPRGTKKATKEVKARAQILREKRRKQMNREIKEREKKLKPYREERADVKKSIPKRVMCGKRRYRFLKSPKGVIPTILQNMLDARANTRKVIKENKKVLKKMGESDGSVRERSDLDMTNKILDQRQLAYKVCCNSMYGAMGVRQGYLPFMPGAMCTTAMGRRNNILAANTIVEKWKGKLVYGDSVTGDTPVMIKQSNGMINIVTIETLANGEYEPYDQFKADQSNRREKQQAQVNVKVWADGVWVDVNRVIRHKTKKRIFRVLTHTGCVDVTEDHSLLDAAGRKLKPVDAKIGQELLHAFPTEFCSDCKDISTEEAFVMGLFFGDGSCGDYKCPSGRKRSWALNNSNLEYLNEARHCLQKCEPSLGWKVLDTLKSSGVYKLVPQGNVKYIVEKYRPLFYDKDKHKKVPMCILNAPDEVRAEFVRGYRVADGTKTGPQRADCKGKIGCQGLYYLFCSLGENVSINTRESKPAVFRLNSTHGKFRKSPTAVKKIIDLGYNDENEFVYDIETTQGRFFGGIGRLILKNTDSEYLFFPHLQDDSKSRSENAATLWNYCETVAKDVTKLYPSPMKLEFEEEIYHRFIILSKKRYMYREMDKQGKLKDKVGNKGVLLTRRDNSDVVRDIYKGVADMFFKKESDEGVMQWIFAKVLDMFRGTLDLEKFVITKATGSVGNLPMVSEAETGTSVQWLQNLEKIQNPDVAKGKVKIGNYVIPMLPKGLTNESLKERNRLLTLKEARNAIEYYTNSLPAHVTLAMKMKSRGIRVDDGTRLEHVVVHCWKKTDKLFLKLEDVNYVRKHSRYVKIDYMYYLKSMVNPLDQMLNACFTRKINRNFMKSVYKYFETRQKMMDAFRRRQRLNFCN